jgi:two-component system sensor histidine kinase AtoS
MQSLALEGISVRFDGSEALKEIDFEIRPGEVHALLGEHGSGKSTLCNVLAGFVQPSHGVVRIDGTRLSNFSVRRAQASGVRLVNQDNRVVETMTVASNLFLNNRSALAAPVVSRTRINRLAAQYIESWDLDISPTEKAYNLHEGERLMINLLKHLYAEPSVLILDESFDKLTAPFLEKAKRRLAEMCERGMALVVVTHMVEELFDFAHHVTILRAGRVLYRNQVEQTNTFDLVRLAYTQMASLPEVSDPGWEFYSLLKLNRAILERLPVNLVVIDESFRLKIINDSARELLRVRADQTANMPWDKLPISVNRNLTAELEAAIQTRRYDTFLNMPLRIDGTALVCDVTVFPIHEADRFLGLIVILNDVTEKEQMRDRMMLAEKLTTVGLLSAGVAHEINNPLEIISNYVDFIRLRPEVSPEIRESLAHIEEEIFSIAQITRNLILFGDKGSDNRSVLEIGAFLEEILHLVRHGARRRDVTMKLIGPVPEAYVEMNETELKQVVLNIVRNGLEAMTDGGTLAVRVERSSGSSSGGQLRDEPRTWVTVSFQDSGPGLQELNANDLFLPFFSTKSNTGENLGLGLAISYSIIQRYGGSLSGRTHPDGGAEFTIELPEHLPEITDAPVTDPGHVASGRADSALSADTRGAATPSEHENPC